VVKLIDQEFVRVIGIVAVADGCRSKPCIKAGVANWVWISIQIMLGKELRMIPNLILEEGINPNIFNLFASRNSNLSPYKDGESMENWVWNTELNKFFLSNWPTRITVFIGEAEVEHFCSVSCQNHIEAVGSAAHGLQDFKFSTEGNVLALWLDYWAGADLEDRKN